MNVLDNVEYGQTLDLQGGSLKIQSDTAGTQRTISSGAVTEVFFTSSATNTLTLNDLELTGAAGGRNGGVMVVSGTAETTQTILGENTTFVDNKTSGHAIPIPTYSAGSVIYAETANIEVFGQGESGIHFVKNEAAGRGGVVSSQSGNISLDNTTFTENATKRASYFPCEGGGAVFSYSGDITINDSTFTKNTSAAKGGAVYARTGNVNITGTNAFSDNKSDWEGGAVVLSGVAEITGPADAVLTISGNNSFKNNSAMNGGGGAITAPEVHFSGTYVFDGNKASAGGALDLSLGHPRTASFSTSTMTGNGTFINNEGQLGGGAILGVDQLTFFGDDSEFLFDNNKGMNWTTFRVELNDIRYDNNTESRVVIKDKGKYTFNGGIDAANLELSDASIRLGSQSYTEVGTHVRTSTDNYVGDFIMKDVTITFVVDGHKTGIINARESDNDIAENETILLDLAKWDGTVPTNPVYLIYGNYRGGDLEEMTDRLVLDTESMEMWTKRYNRNTDYVWIGRYKSIEEIVGDEDIPGTTPSVSVNRQNYLNAMIAQRMNTFNNNGWCCCPEETCDVSCSAISQTRSPCGGWNLWASGFGWTGETGKYNHHTGGVLAGLDRYCGDTLLGAYIGVGDSELGSFSANLDSSDVMFGGYAKWNSHIFGGYTALLGNFSFSDNDLTRVNKYGSFSSEFDALQSSAMLEKGWKAYSDWGTYLNPYASLQYINYRADDYQSGILSIQDVEMDSLRSSVGVRFGREVVSRNGRTVSINLGSAWLHELMDTSGTFIASYKDDTAQFKGLDGGRDWWQVNAGLGLDLTDNVSVSTDYYLFVNNRSTVQAGMGTVTCRF